MEKSGSDERTWGMLCHITALAGYFIPFGNILGPLIVWLVKKDESAFVDDQGKESLNFQLSATIYIIVAAVLCLVLIGIPILIGLLIFHLVVIIIATVRSSEGERYRYPLTIRFFQS
ncbi:MAG: DUF4870 domain-containing protein [Chloroflexaceae bacterium]|nr:DUF4870 domain-containing protein [Chloroflexaceae bacterium]